MLSKYIQYFLDENNLENGVQKKPWQPEIGDVYFYVAVDEGRNKGVIHSQ